MAKKLLMKRFLAIFLLAATMALYSCDKSADGSSVTLTGKWIEKSLRLDTIDFDPPFAGAYDSTKRFLLKSKPYMDITLNPTYPMNPSSIFSYYTKADSMYVYNLISSAFIYRPYTFSMIGNNSFAIGKFYLRNSLPSTLEFVKLQ